MSRKRTTEEEQHASDTRGKLSQLLETEQELDAMLKETKARAWALLEAAKTEADERVRRCDLELEAADDELRVRVEAERDQSIVSIRAEVERDATKLDELGQSEVRELAGYVIALLVGGAVSGGSP